MANELQIAQPTGLTLYAHVFDAAGQVWDTTAGGGSGGFVAWDDADWGDYAISVSEVGTSARLYQGDFDPGVAGTYTANFYKQLGGGAAADDEWLGADALHHSGTSEVTQQTIHNALTGAGVALTSGERDAVAAALLDLTDGVEPSLTLRESLRLIVAAAAGKVSGSPNGPIHIRDLQDTKNRITATVDGNGNRTAVSRNKG